MSKKASVRFVSEAECIERIEELKTILAVFEEYDEWTLREELADMEWLLKGVTK